MNDADYRSIATLLSDKRLSKFLDGAQDGSSALNAYEWSLGLGQSLLKPIGMTEVFLRNTMDCTIAQWWQEQGYQPPWTSTDAEGLAPELDKLCHRADWKRRAERNLAGHTATHDDIIAHTSFGTWRNFIGNPAALLPCPPEDKNKSSSWHAAKRNDALCADLWRQMLSSAFPNIPRTKRERGGQSPRGYIGARITRISRLRNRVCHWDSLLDINPLMSYLDMIELVSCIDYAAERWMDACCGAGIRDICKQKPSWLHGIREAMGQT